MDYDDYIDFLNHLFLQELQDSHYHCRVFVACEASTSDALTIL